MPEVWVHAPGLRLRPVPEQACCLAYLPRDAGSGKAPVLHGLNVTSWFVLSLCDGRGDLAVQAEFDMAMAESGGIGTAQGMLGAALEQLRALGLIRHGIKVGAE